MAQSKKNPDRKKKVQKFKEQAATNHAQAQIPKTHLVPIPEWQSNENLELRGDYLEILENSLITAMDALNKCGQVMHYVLQKNVENGKIKLNYNWNNGEKATEAEVESYKAELKKAQDERLKQMELLQANLQKQANAAKTGLVGPDGVTPVATDQDLSQEEKAETIGEENIE